MLDFFDKIAGRGREEGGGRWLRPILASWHLRHPLSSGLAFSWRLWKVLTRTHIVEISALSCYLCMGVDFKSPIGTPLPWKSPESDCLFHECSCPDLIPSCSLKIAHPPPPPLLSHLFTLNSYNVFPMLMHLFTSPTAILYLFLWSKRIMVRCWTSTVCLYFYNYRQ